MDYNKINRSRFPELIEKNRGMIHKVSLMYTNNRADKEDMYQEICLQLWKAIGNYREEASLSTWLYRVALNTAINSLRSKARRISTEELIPERHYTVKDNQKEDQTSLLFAAISKLNKIDKALILLWLEDKKYDEITEITGLKRSNVSVRLVRIRKKLKDIIKQIEK